MCGIAGIVGQQAIAPETLAAMMASLRRRGPDAEHVVGWNVQGERIDNDPSVALIHTRLAIMDPRAKPTNLSVTLTAASGFATTVKSTTGNNMPTNCVVKACNLKRTPIPNLFCAVTKPGA